MEIPGTYVKTAMGFTTWYTERPSEAELAKYKDHTISLHKNWLIANGPGKFKVVGMRRET